MGESNNEGPSPICYRTLMQPGWHELADLDSPVRAISELPSTAGQPPPMAPGARREPLFPGVADVEALVI